MRSEKEQKALEVVAALIRDGDRFLVGQRPAHKDRGLLWEFVGGKVEAGESHVQALARECREELGITVSVGEVCCVLTHSYPDRTVRLTLLYASITAGEPQRLEHHDLRWMTLEEAEQYPFCPADQEILARMRQEEGQSGQRKP